MGIPQKCQDLPCPPFFASFKCPASQPEHLVPSRDAASGFVVLFILGIWLTPHDLVQKRYAKLEPRSRLIFYREGLAATATIFQRPDGERILYLNGIPEVRTDLNSVRTFKLMGALPTLLHENPTRSLIISFGAGDTTGTVAISATSN